MARRYKTEAAAMRRVENDARLRGVWSAIIRKVDVDGKRYYVLSFDCLDEYE